MMLFFWWLLIKEERDCCKDGDLNVKASVVGIEDTSSRSVETDRINKTKKGLVVVVVGENFCAIVMLNAQVVNFNFVQEEEEQLFGHILNVFFFRLPAKNGSTYFELFNGYPASTGTPSVHSTIGRDRHASENQNIIRISTAAR
jgi:hypothetical protein